ncbi:MULTISPECIES: LysR family transcriptional regulator [Kiloniella]|uniref:LysR family transcriptional regulator n=1 Tax=Kiloniella TaxID=454159 RepID=UPI000A278EC5|nr:MULTISPECIES: LysR family transcriptional regulator [Kiloniella]
MNPTFDWNDLRPFLAVARTGKLTIAAKRLKVDHTTVSRRIQALETALNATLFERGPQGYALTEIGQRLLGAAESMETMAMGVQNEIAGADLDLTGAVRIGAPDGFGSYFLAPRICDLCRSHPGLEIDLVAMPRMFSLSKREADIAIGLSRPTEGRLRSRKLTDYRLGLYASPEYLERRGPITHKDQLKEHRLVGYIEDLIFSPELNYVPQIGKELRPQLRSTNLIAQMHATSTGAGICILPCFMADNQENLVPVLREEVNFMRTFWLIYHADLQGFARIRAAVDFIVEKVTRERKVFLPET